mmetsp:Transcript_85636/g.266286  ORF Transcript_85636/g.266286 Transcript_85636/m.266286 type:complete len:225 (+) Transcript_85636:310-984(+)
MFLAVSKLALVGSAVGPLEGSGAALDVVHVLARVDATVRKGELASAVHHVPPPLAVVSPAVPPGVDPVAVEVVLAELALVLAALLLSAEGEGAVAALEAVLVLPHKSGSVRHEEQPLPVLSTVLPLPLVHGAILQRTHAYTVGLVVHPRSYVHAAVGVLKGAMAVRLALPEHAPVPTDVGVDLVAEAVRQVAQPLARVEHAIGERVRRPLLSLLVVDGAQDILD